MKCWRRTRGMADDDRYRWETGAGSRVVVHLKCWARLAGRPEVKHAQEHSPAVPSWAQRPPKVSEHLNGATAIFESPSQPGRPRADVDDGAILALAYEGLSSRQIAAKVGVSQPTVVRRLKDHCGSARG